MGPTAAVYAFSLVGLGQAGKRAAASLAHADTGSVFLA
jgi:hypothetical protein